MVGLPTQFQNIRVNRGKVEALFWFSGLLAIAVGDPHSEGLFSVCPFDAVGSWVGLSFCPGCGLGHAVGFLVRGQLAESLTAHPLAIPAVLTLTLHIRRLLSGPRSDSI